MKLEELRLALVDICRSHLSEDDAALLISLARPAVRLQHTGSATSSHLGGTAQMSSTTAWPSNAQGEALSLLCVLDLAELEAFETDLALPSAGILNVFYDYEEQPWGFRPSDRNGWRVICADAANSAASAPPIGTTTFVSLGLEPSQTLTLPGWEEDAVAPLFPPHSDRSESAERARQRYFAVEDAWVKVVGRPLPNHQVGGWPSLQQGPIWRESDLVSRGHPLGTSEEWKAAQPFRSSEREGQWSMLLQIDTDDETDWMWGDVGTLYFTVQRPFDSNALPESAWMALQCG